VSSVPTRVVYAVASAPAGPIQIKCLVMPTLQNMATFNLTTLPMPRLKRAEQDRARAARALKRARFVAGKALRAAAQASCVDRRVKPR
jgi:hypothetical protein